MKASVFAISNNRNSSMRYLSALHGYGYSVKDVQSFEAGRVLLRTGYNPDIIVIDVKFHADDIAEFLRFVRKDLGNHSVYIVVVGGENDYLLAAYGANICLERPANIEDILTVLNPSF